MKGSKFKIFILFIIGLLGVVIPVDAYASDYNFGYQAFSCGGTTNAQYKACITKYYNGEEIPRIENGDTVNPGGKPLRFFSPLNSKFCRKFLKNRRFKKKGEGRKTALDV